MSSPASAPPTLKDVRCPDCGVAQQPSNPACTECGREFVSMCHCGTEVSYALPRCSGCNTALLHPRFVPPSRKKRLMVGLVALVLLVGVPLGGWTWQQARIAEREPRELIMQAHQHYEDGDFDLAQPLLERALELNPRDHAAHFMLGQVERQLKADPASYLEHLEAAARLHAGETIYQAKLSQALFELGRYEEARVWATRATSGAVVDPHAWQLLGEIELRSASPDYTRALELFQRARSSGLDRVDVRARIAHLRVQLLGATQADRLPADLAKELEGLVPEVERLAVRERANPAEIELHAELLERLGRGSEAIEAARRALLTRSSDAPASHRARLQFLIGRCFFEQDRRSESETAFAQALAIEPDVIMGSEIAQFLMARGEGELAERLLVDAAQSSDPAGGLRSVLSRFALARGDISAATTLAEEAIGTSGAPDVVLLLLKGDVARANGDFEKAREAYAAAAAQTDRATPFVRLALLSLDAPGTLEERRNAIRAAVDELLERVRDAGDGPEFNAALGILRGALGDTELSIQNLEAAVRSDPSSALLWLQLARAWSDSTDPEALKQIARAYGKAVELRPRDEGVVVPAARAALALGETETAVEICGVLLAAHPDNVPVRRLRAEAFLRMPDLARGIEEFERMRLAGALTEQDATWLLEAYYQRNQKQDAWDLMARWRERGGGSLPAGMLLVRARHEAVSAVGDPGTASVFRAAQYLLNGQVEEGVVTLRELYAAQPDDLLISRLLVVALLSQGDQGKVHANPAELAEARAVATSLSPDIPRPLREFIEGRVLQAEGKQAEALPKLKYAATQLPDDPYAQFHYGDALFFTGNDTASVPALRRSTFLPGALRGFRLAVSQRLLVIALRTEDMLRREALLHEVLVLDPTSLPAVDELVRVLMLRGRYEDAARVDEGRLEIGDLDADTERRLRYRALVGRLESFQFRAAEVHLRALETVGISSDEPALELAVRAMLLFRTGRLDEARALFADALAENADHRVACVGLLLVFSEQRAHAEALGLLERWTARHPDDQRVWISYTRMLTARAAFEQARGVGLRARELWPNSSEALRQLVQPMWLLGEREAAIELVRGARRRGGEASRSELDMLLAELLAKDAAHAQEAFDLAQAALDAPSASPQTRRLAQLAASEALLSVGRHEDAAPRIAELTTDWREGRPVLPLDQVVESRVRWVRGLLAYHQSREAQAAREFQLCLALDPANLAAANNLAWLQATDVHSSSEAWGRAQWVTDRAPAVPDYWDTRGYCALAAGQPDDAESSFKRALGLFDAQVPPAIDSWIGTCRRLAEMLYDRGRVTEARKYAREAAARAPAGVPMDWAKRILEQ